MNVDLIERMAAAGSVERRLAETVALAFRHVVDRLVADDFTVLAAPLIVGRRDPVFERLRELVKRDDWSLPEYGVDARPEELANCLHLPLEIVELYPLVGDAGVLVRVIDLLRLTDDDLERVMAMWTTWIQQFLAADGGAAPYVVHPVGRESAIGDWLHGDPGILRPFGFDVARDNFDGLPVRSREHVFDDRRRADLIFRASENSESLAAGDWLVVELKATRVASPAAEQLARYVDWLQRDLGPDHTVRGLLVADGITVNLGRALRERQMSYLSLAELGYRDLMWGETSIREQDPDETTALAGVVEQVVLPSART